jgi:TPR repeat protein
VTTPSPAAVVAPPALDVPATRDALLRAEMLCDQKKDFDACSRAAIALETGTTGPADLEQAKRFRRIALTHLVAQCEVDSPHACFVLAAKYRAGTELASKPTSAEALEKRGAELCRLGRAAPECPAP